MISVFTPTYNRADTLYRVWESLLSQTFTDFEWVIIDDGSSDNIEEIVAEYERNANFPIIFYKLPVNCGKHIATNKGLELATRQFFIVADSDDGFTSDALQVFINTWQSIPTQERGQYCGVRACCTDQEGNRVSDRIPRPYLDATMADAYYKFNIRKETWTMVLTAWHRNFLFPTDHVGYHPEGVIWKAMSRVKMLRWVDTSTRIYYRENDPNSLMNAAKPAKSKISRNLVGSGDILNNDIHYLKYDVVRFIKTTILYSYYSLEDGNPYFHMMNIKNWKGRSLIALLFPISILVFLYKKVRD